MAIGRRTFGASGVELSEVAYGSMRLRGDRSANATLLSEMHDIGITTHHSSSEYDSYESYCDLVRRLRTEGRTIEHIVKLACPSFDESGFDPEVLRDRVEAELYALDTERLDVVQWMVRGDAAGDGDTKRAFARAYGAMVDGAFGGLIQAGKVGAVALFPYVQPPVEALLELDAVTGLCGYLNLLERELCELAGQGYPTIALRPLAAGLLGAQAAPEVPPPLEPRRARRADVLDELGIEALALPAAALRYPLSFDAVASQVVSISTSARLVEILEALGVDR
ncbi:MAG: aldo/keto reductase [Actinomycetota bacterium]